jgi:hypothetical protein
MIELRDAKELPIDASKRPRLSGRRGGGGEDATTTRTIKSLVAWSM